jgi:transposase InsO family protein
MRSHIRRFIDNCPECQKQSEVVPDMDIYRTTLSSAKPMERLDIDTIGPLPEDEEGNKFVLVVIDAFSRFTVVYPIKRATAKEAARALMHHFGTFGQPMHIMTDSGSQFVNETIAAIAQMWSIGQIITTPYSKEENGIVERANKEVMKHLRNICF